MAAEKKSDVVTAREVIANYIKGDACAVVTYRKICNAFELVNNWEEATARQFIEQMLDLGDVVDHTCNTLVQRIATMKWTAIPADMREKWRNLLCEIGVRQVVHLETIYTCAILNLVPATDIDPETKKHVLRVAEEEQEDFYGMAHSIIAQLLICVPVSSKMASRLLSRYFPHHTAPTIKFTAYVRNMINASEYGETIRAAVWETIIDRLVTVDTLIGRPGDGEDSGAEIFVMDDQDEEDSGNWEESTREQVVKLDEAVHAVVLYLQASHGLQIDENDAEWMHCSGEISESIFTCLQDAFEKHLLTSTNVRYVSFLWMLTANLRESYQSRILSFLWEVLLRPSTVAGEARRSHGAASYLAAFLARANFVSIDVAMSYLEKMASYLVAYIDRVGLSSRTIVPGLAHHGVFYAMANAFFLAFAFRYKEIAKSDRMDEVRHWGIGRFIHSSLDPLKYSMCSVARCFAAVSRSLQIVYCNHVLPLSYDDVRRPFQPSFPFDVYGLPRTLSVMTPLTRKFSPMKEDWAMLSGELKGDGRGKNAEGEGEEDEGALDFLDEDDLHCTSSARPISSYTSPLFTVYSTSPGLRPFIAGSPMDTR